MTQLNTPYPATAYLTGFLKQENYDVAQRDLAIDLFYRYLPGKGWKIFIRLSKITLPILKTMNCLTPSITFYSTIRNTVFV